LRSDQYGRFVDFVFVVLVVDNVSVRTFVVMPMLSITTVEPPTVVVVPTPVVGVVVGVVVAGGVAIAPAVPPAESYALLSPRLHAASATSATEAAATVILQFI
jgi:hypothetical protein